MNDFVRWLPEPIATNALVARVPLAATILGDSERPILGIAALSPGQQDTLSFCDRDDARERVAASGSSPVIVSTAAGATPRQKQTLIVVADPRAWFIAGIEMLLPGATRPPEPALGIDSTAHIHPDARIASGAAIGAGVEIGAGTRVGAGAVIYAECTIGAQCCIGPGTVIGGVGLAYHDDEDGRRLFFPHLAGVRIGDAVDIGANCCVCRGMLADTSIGDQVKIGSQVYIGHGVVIEDRVWISASSAIAGHARIGRAALIGIGSVVVDNAVIAGDTLVGAGAVVTRPTRTGEKLVGVPARHVETLRRFGPTPR